MSPKAQLFVFGVFIRGLLGTSQSLLSSLYIYQDNVVCLRLFRQTMACALAFARDKAGRSSPARIAMIAMTAKSSMRVKARINLQRRFVAATVSGGALR